jgi:hypothetical protein
MSAGAHNKILLISGTSPGEPGVGGVILKDLVSIAGPENMSCIWLSPHRDQSPHYIPELKSTILQRRYESGWRPVRGIAGEVISWAATGLIGSRHLNELKTAVRAHIAETQPTLILCVLESVTAIRVMHALIGRVTVPVQSIVWDDVRTFCPETVLDRWSRARIYKQFAEVLQQSQRVAVICENMAEAYRKDYRVESTILRHGMADVTEGDISPTTDHAKVFRIGFAGSITAPDCMQALIQYLDSRSWRFEGRDVCLRMLGSRFLLGTKSRQWIEYLGWRDVNETRDLLGQCDLLFLPQSFEKGLRHLSELSFPTKLSTYISTRVPIFLNAPEYGSLSKFWSHYELGPVARALSQDSIQQALFAGFTANPTQRQQWEEQRQRARREVLSEEIFRREVRAFLDLPRLLPTSSPVVTRANALIS